MKVYIGVAAHKFYPICPSEEYVPIQVGAAGKEMISGFTQDDCGKNISQLNPYFSELTAAYYIWQNVQSDVKGMVHYRRYLGKSLVFGKNSTQKVFDAALKKKDIERLLTQSPVIVASKRHYYIESNYSHYAHAHNVQDLDITGKIIKELYPKYSNEFDIVMKKSSAHMFNMYIMKGDLFDQYHKWLFDILFELNKRIDITDYSAQESRVFGYISELLLDVWLGTNKISPIEAKVLYTEQQHVLKKAINFIRRKILGTGESHIRSSVD
ncbi:lipopolysaccharide biosynthesis glycosyltransferase [Lacticaseibacillus paracasei subsp. tolerans DSM 20258]|nr:lipopolysaccharide biosynthesis glycosyltransferase [Lacticaseibacillus paracasei subsp. tolerans DSM 20258]MCT3362969.1 DUF4422 domain-containing protein [Lacticaseibacillus paracasei]GEL38641.1 glycosyl transferase [Lacticaseibacillus paracasei subsp. tolerans]